MNRVKKESPTASRDSALTRRSSFLITAASISGAVAGYVVLAIVSRSLTVAEASLFATFWAALFTTYGILTGVGTETARAVSAATLDRSKASAYARIGRVAVLVAVVVFVVAALSALAWARPVFGASHQVLAAVVVLSASAYAVEAVLLGALSGTYSWAGYSGVLAWEAGARVVLVGLVSLWAAQVVPIAIASAAAAAMWVVLLAFSRALRQVLKARIDVPTSLYMRRAGTAALATGASAILLVGFPIMTSLTTSATVYATAAPLMFAVSLTRAPIMVPLTSFQSVIIASFVRKPSGALKVFLRLLVILMGAGIVGGGFAYLIGPWLMATLFGPEYRLNGLILAALTFASVGTALLTITGALCQAFTRHGAFLLGWLIALAVSISILLCPASMETRVILALLIAPYSGLVVHLIALLPVLRRAAAGVDEGAVPKHS